MTNQMQTQTLRVANIRKKNYFTEIFPNMWNAKKPNMIFSTRLNSPPPFFKTRYNFYFILIHSFVDVPKKIKLN
jgi:hypothetical protein